MFWRVGARGEIVGETAGCGRGPGPSGGEQPSLGWDLLGALVEMDKNLSCSAGSSVWLEVWPE